MALTFSALIRASDSCSKITRRASRTDISRREVFRGTIFSSIPCRSTSICSMPMPVNIIGTAFCSTVISTRRSSIAPAASMPRIFSRVRWKRSGDSGPSVVVSKAGGVGARRSKQPLFRPPLGLLADVLLLLLPDQADGVLDQLADHALHVAAVVAHFRVAGGLDLDERGPGELGQPPGDLRLAHAGGPDHHDVLGRDFLPHFRRDLLPPPAVANGHGHGPLGRVLAHDVPVQLLDDFPRGQLSHASSSTMMLVFV